MYVIQYDELVLKGKNRRVFEDKLLRNLHYKLKSFTETKVQRKYGKFVLHVEASSEVSSILATTPGIKYFAIAEVFDFDLDSVETHICKIFPSEVKSFRVHTSRSNKKFPMQSTEINQRLGSAIVAKYGTKVALKQPECTIFVQIAEKEIYVYTSREAGMGGLPVGSSGRVVSLLSGGIDSPVASTMMMTRGCEVLLFHAYNHTLRPKALKDKIMQISETLAKIQGKVTLCMLPYKALQKEIVEHIPGPYRMIAFKRSIVRVACLLAHNANAKAIVTGDSVGQVASQTLENIQCIYAASSFPVLSPLIGFDKQSIIDLAQKFGTYETSILPYEDCCSLIATDHPRTRGVLEEIEAMEADASLLSLEKELVENCRYEVIQGI